MSLQIAIDGPAGAGKSTIAKIVSRELGFVYIDTGAMYRAMALYFIRMGLKPGETGKMALHSGEADIKIGYGDGVQRVYLNGEGVDSLIRTSEVSEMASLCSNVVEVREKMVYLQKQLAQEENVVMDGRDIGTCVLPAADLKVFLTADIQIRAQRRMAEMKRKGIHIDIETLQKDIEERDNRDMMRENSPLKQAEDAVLIDTSHMTLKEVADEVISLFKERCS